MRKPFGVWGTAALLAALGVGPLALRLGAAPPPAPDAPGGLLLGSEPEPDAGPLPPGTPPQPHPLLFRAERLPTSDPFTELRQLKRRAEWHAGPVLGPLPADAARQRELLDALGGGAAPGSRQRPAPASRPVNSRGFRVTQTGARQRLNVVASPVAWGKLPLRSGRRVILEARNGAGGKPLLYLIRTGRQVAYSGEPAGGGAAVLTYTPEEDGEFQFLVRGPGDGTVGSCDLYLDGIPLFRRVTFGGAAVPATWAAGDEFQTAHLPFPAHRMVDTVLYAFDGRGRFIARNDDGGVNGGSRLVMDAASAQSDAHLLISTASQNPADGGQVRVYMNRLSRGDPDGDRLATPLEAELGTDPAVADTDGDGLRDDWELFGLHTPAGDEDLPAYSDPWTDGPAADPTRMDLFVELDWMAGRDGTPHYYRLTDEGVAHAVRALRERGGVWLHFDVGQMGARGSRGGQWFDHQPRFHFTGTMPRSMQDVWSSPDYFAAGRRHLFAYGLAIDRFAPTVTISGEMRRMDEDGQIINSPEVWNSRYSPGFMICNGTGLYNRPTRQAAVLMHELGHCLSLRHGGDVDANNKPNYISVMNYLFTLTLTDADALNYSEGGLEALEERTLDEKAGLGFPLPDHLYEVVRGSRRGDVRTLEEPTALDWNGNFVLDGRPVAADINGDGRLERLTDYDDWQAVRQPAQGFGWVGLNAGIEEWTSYNDLP